MIANRNVDPLPTRRRAAAEDGRKLPPYQMPLKCNQLLSVSNYLNLHLLILCSKKAGGNALLHRSSA
jgi:hypothetical protein